MAGGLEGLLGGGGIMPFARKNSDTLLQLGAGLLGGQNTQEQLAGGLNGMIQGRKQTRTVQFLQQADPELAQAVESGVLSGGDAFKLYHQRKLEAQKPRNNFMAVGKNLYDVQSGEWVTPPAGAGGDDAEYGLNPQYGTDAQGNPVLIQLSKSGTSRQTPLPDGVSLSKEPIKLDAGTHFVLLDPITRQPVGQIPKDLAGAESQKAQGKAQGEAIVAAPAGIERAQQTIRQVDQLLASPGLDSIVGSFDQYRPTWALGPRGNNALSRLNQLQGGAFLQAFEMLKGGGAITETEGQKAEAAVARLQRAQDEATFRAALMDFRDAVESGEKKLRERAGMGATPAGGGTLSSSPEVDNLVQRYGSQRP